MCDHLEKVQESYFKHLITALKYSMRFLGAFLASVIHAVFPCMFENTASDIARHIVKDVDERNACN